MKKILLFLLIILFGSVLFFREEVSDYFTGLSFRLSDVEKEIIDLMEQAEKQILTPEPLIAPEEASQSFLTQAGVIQLTNVQREKHGLSPFRENADLNESALLKVQDMLANQYFKHISPLGEDVGDLAEAAGYEFITIGENLAMGNFKDDQILIQDWMDSPGHRANVLSSNFQEMGAAVLQGEFEGKKTWLAVQHFGLSLDICPQPSEELEAEIAENQKNIESLQELMSGLRQEIEDMKPKGGQAYSQKIEQYNELVSRYNDLIYVTKDLTGQYNSQVILFNECAAGF